MEKLTLENIRSYAESTPIELPTGSTLFEGDIGSGKSTILSGIEFALFGLGDIDSKFLLRSSAKRGSVLLDFKVGNNRYQVFRELVRAKKNVNQGVGYIVEDGTRTEYSVNEMKARILEIIGINERPHARTTSLIFRSAIFTPQEMMKQVLLDDKDRRLDTLRRAFGIQEYSSAAKNSDAVDLWARGEVRVSTEIARDLPELMTKLGEESTEQIQIDSEISTLSLLLNKAEADLQQIEERIIKMKDERDAVLQLEASIPGLERGLKKAEELLHREMTAFEKLKKESVEVEKAFQKTKVLQPEYATYMEEKREMGALEATAESFASNSSKKEKLESTIQNEKSRLESDITRLADEIAVEESEFKTDSNEVRPLRGLLSIERRLKNNTAALPATRRHIIDHEKKIAGLNSSISSLRGNIKKGKVELDGILKIGVGAQCPKCKQTLSEKHLEELKSQYASEKAVTEEKLGALDGDINKLNDEKTALQKMLDRMEKDEGESQQIGRKIVALQAKSKEIARAKPKIANHKVKLREMRKQLKAKEFAVSERKQLLVLEKLMSQQVSGATRYAELRRRTTAADKRGVQSDYLTCSEKAKRKPSLDQDMQDAQGAVAQAETDVKTQQEGLRKKKEVYSNRKPVIEEISKLEAHQKQLRTKRDSASTAIATSRANLNGVGEEVKRLGVEIAKRQQANRRKEYHEQLRVWLDQCFVPAIQDIEKHAMLAVNEQFNQEFQRWFNVLIETGEITVEVDDAFTPTVTQGGYALDVNSLSGGERTSVALAYRLALNITVRAVAGLQPDLLILDEPTDGFSSEQLVKLRFVLDGLNTAQIIMVSHERELETFVQNICKVTKEAGMSHIEFIRR